MDTNSHAKKIIDQLQYFYKKQSVDGIDGLEAKLKKGDRETEIISALAKKELFSKLLEQWSYYASAQEIFAYLLSQAEYEFNYLIHPEIPNKSKVEINQMVKDQIVVPTLNQCPPNLFVLNHANVMGMLYWLAEQCFVRWHQ